MKKNAMRGLLVLLVLIMLFGLIPTTALADEDAAETALAAEAATEVKEEASTTKTAEFYYYNPNGGPNNYWPLYKTVTLTDGKIYFPDDYPYVRGRICRGWGIREDFTAGGKTYDWHTSFFFKEEDDGLDVSDSTTDVFKFYTSSSEWTNVIVNVKAVGLVDGDTMPMNTIFSSTAREHRDRFYVGDSQKLTSEVKLSEFKETGENEYSVTLHAVPLTYFNETYFKRNGSEEVDGYDLTVKRTYTGGRNGLTHPDYDPYVITYTFTYEKIQPVALTITKEFVGLTDAQIESLKGKAKFLITPKDGDPAEVVFNDQNFQIVDGKLTYTTELYPGTYTVEEVVGTWDVEGYVWTPDVRTKSSGWIIDDPVVERKAAEDGAKKASMDEVEQLNVLEALDKEDLEEKETAEEKPITPLFTSRSVNVTIKKNTPTTVTCTNYYQESQPGELTINKRFEGLSDSQIASLKGATFEIQLLDIEGNPVGEPIPVKFDGSKDFSTKVEVDTPGTYQVTETTGWNLKDYKWTSYLSNSTEGDSLEPGLIDIGEIGEIGSMDDEMPNNRSIAEKEKETADGPPEEAQNPVEPIGGTEIMPDTEPKESKTTIVTIKTPGGSATVDCVNKYEYDPSPSGSHEPPALNKDDHFAYVIGYPDGEVKPNGTITRAEVATIFFRMLKDESRDSFWSQTNSFNDVALEAWFNNAISTLENGGILTGYPDGSFNPNGNITRAEFATMAIRFFQDAKVGPSKFSDTIGHWAEEAINKALNEGLITGYPDGSFRPDEPITRAEAMTIINRVLDRHPDKDHLLSNMIKWPDNMDKSVWYYAEVQEATNSHEYEMVGGRTPYEIWQSLLPVRDWAAFEKAWSNSHAASNPGDVI